MAYIKLSNGRNGDGLRPWVAIEPVCAEKFGDMEDCTIEGGDNIMPLGSAVNHVKRRDFFWASGGIMILDVDGPWIN